MPNPYSHPGCPICAFMSQLNPGAPDEEQPICGECADAGPCESEATK